MRILITDKDNERIDNLKETLSQYGYVDILKSAKKTFTLFCYGDGVKKYDILFISDYMKDFDNKRTIYKIRELEKEIKDENERLLIVILSDKVNKSKVFEFFQLGCSNFLVSPFDADTVFKKIQFKFEYISKKEKQLCGKVKEEYMDPNIKLPTLPNIFFQFRELVDKDAYSEEIASLLEKDMMISANLIRLSNSAFFGGIEKNKNVLEAINRLGLSECHQMIATICAKKLFATNSETYKGIVSILFKFSLTTAFLTQFMADKFGISQKGYPFLMGLLGNVGRLFMIVIIAEMDEKKIKNKNISIETIYSAVEKYHSNFASKILKTWEFDEAFINTSVEMVYKRQKLKPDAKKEIFLIRLAVLYAGKDCMFGPEFSERKMEELIDSGDIDISPSELMEMKQKVDTLIKDIIS